MEEEQRQAEMYNQELTLEEKQQREEHEQEKIKVLKERERELQEKYEQLINMKKFLFDIKNKSLKVERVKPSTFDRELDLTQTESMSSGSKSGEEVLPDHFTMVSYRDDFTHKKSVNT